MLVWIGRRETNGFSEKEGTLERKRMMIRVRERRRNNGGNRAKMGIEMAAGRIHGGIGHICRETG